MRIKELFAILLLSISSTYASSLTLVGGDAWTFHGNTAFGQQIVDYMGGNVAFINDANWGPDGTIVSVQGVNVTVYATMPDLPTLLGFTGVYFDSPGNCCGDPGTAPSLFSPTYASDLTAYMAAGGNVAIQDWEANAAWDHVFWFDASPGFLGGRCSTHAASTPVGQGHGFTGDGTDGAGSGQYKDDCFTHQNYDSAFFAANGFATLMMDTDNVQADLISGVPEPSVFSLMLIGAGLTVLGLRGRRSSTK
jgi:hypothetical protein